MLDIEPELDRKLRALYDHIEAQEPPASLALITSQPFRSGHKVVSRIVSVAGIAAIAAGIVLFATELNAHRITTSTTHPASPPSPVWLPSPLPSPNPRLALPSLPDRTLLPASVRVLVPETQGTGEASVTIVPEGELFIQYACVSGGVDSVVVLPNPPILGPDVRPKCSSSAAAATVVGTALPEYPNEVLKVGNLGKPVTLKISAGSSTTWEIFIAESAPYYGANLITNGSFEQPVVNPPLNSGNPPTFTSLPGWTMVGGVGIGSSALDPGYPALNGSQYLVLTGTVRTPGEVSQRVHTVPGDTYRLTFLEGSIPEACAGDPYVIDVSWNGMKVLGLSSTLVPPSKSSPEPTASSTGPLGGPGSPPSAVWHTAADTSLVATTTTTTISFAGGAGCGAALDEVILQQVLPTS
jgi:hypothetical protein